MIGAPASALRRAVRACALAVAVVALAPGCGKKGPLRLPDERPPERAATPGAAIREGQVILTFRVPAHRVFPEREEPWVLARILRRDLPANDFLEVGAVLERDGFAFDARLTWSEAAHAAGASAYRVEFRDGARRRRALSEPLEVAWLQPPGAPQGLEASGDDRAVSLSWDAPSGASAETRYRVYRRDRSDAQPALLTLEPVATRRHTDSRIEAAREYCYQVRAVLGAPALIAEGSPTAEVCVRTEDATPPPPPAALRLTATAGSFQLAWDEVAATDLLGYRVYRALDDGPFELLTAAPVRGNAYREDVPVQRGGARYRYVVTAVDNSARQNESTFSPAAEARALQQTGTP